MGGGGGREITNLLRSQETLSGFHMGPWIKGKEMLLRRFFRVLNYWREPYLYIGEKGERKGRLLWRLRRGAGGKGGGEKKEQFIAYCFYCAVPSSPSLLRPLFPPRSPFLRY